jgi:glycosyltransferase involved in cell wall biosynthesis
MNSSTKIIGVAFGDPLGHKTFSGYSRHLFTAIRDAGRLAGTAKCKNLRPIDFLSGCVSLQGFRRPRLSRHWLWRESTVEKLSRRIRPQLDAIDAQSPLLQVGTHVYPVSGSRRAYYCVTDMTVKQAVEAGRFKFRDFAPEEAAQAIAIQKKILDRQTRIFVLCQWTKESIVEDYGQPEDKVIVIGAGANLPSLEPAENKYTEPSLLFVGFDWERKGGPLLLEAFRRVRARIPQAELHIVGCAPQANGPGVDVVGPLSRSNPVDRERLENFYRTATCFCILPEFDPFPNVLLEAQHCGTPVVSLDVGSRRDAMIPGETGLLVSERDPDKLAAAIVDILGDPHRAQRMGEAGRRFVSENYTWPIVAAHVLREIEASCRPGKSSCRSAEPVSRAVEPGSRAVEASSRGVEANGRRVEASVHV